MPKVHLDISIHSDDDAIGMVSGPFEVERVPQIGDPIDFGDLPDCDVTVEERGIPFTGELRATRVLDPVSDDRQYLVMLETVVGRSENDARILLAFFEQAHGLFAEIWDRPDSG